MNFGDCKSKQNDDYVFPSPNTDSISQIACNGTLESPSTMLVSSAWDNSVNCYALTYSHGAVKPVAIPQAQIKHAAPALCVTECLLG